jgi:hypothetical protein
VVTHEYSDVFLARVTADVDAAAICNLVEVRNPVHRCALNFQICVHYKRANLRGPFSYQYIRAVTNPYIALATSACLFTFWPELHGRFKGCPDSHSTSAIVNTCLSMFCTSATFIATAFPCHSLFFHVSHFITRFPSPFPICFPDCASPILVCMLPCHRV